MPALPRALRLVSACVVLAVALAPAPSQAAGGPAEPLHERRTAVQALRDQVTRIGEELGAAAAAL